MAEVEAAVVMGTAEPPSLDEAEEETQHRTWCPDESECWKLYDIKLLDAAESVVHVCSKRDARARTFNLSEVHSFDPSHLLDLDNISNMNNVHEGPLLDLLRRRYAKDNIYTFTGDILISVNPYKNVPGLYDLPSADVVVTEDAKPHLYTVAARALECLREDPDEEQTVIVNGESGAGKTEASKHIIRLLGHLSKDGQTEFLDVQQQIIDTNLLLEEFGNAKTVRNDNSSRFGKYIRLEYRKPENRRDVPVLTGAHISYFLLETSRIVSRSSKERNYHVFYALCEGATEVERQMLGLRKAEAYRYLQSSKAAEDSMIESIPGRDEGEVWYDLKASLRSLGLDDDDVFEVSRSLTTVLELGNVVVQERERRIEGNEAAQNVVVAEIDQSQEALKRVNDLLGLNTDMLCLALTGRVVVSNSARGSMQRVELSRSQAIESINALAKAIYSRLFDWLLMHINIALAGGEGALNDREASSYIGILDIYGFEILEKNSFEQLCINFANERLQRQFNSKVFDAEQHRYMAEGVQWAFEDFGVDNQPCIDLIGQSRLGILSILDEQTLMLYHAMGISSGSSISRSARQVEDQLLQKLHTAHGGKHPNYIKPRIAGTTFKVRHFAGVVEYDVTNFPLKNTDTLHSDLIMLMSGSHRPFVQALFQRDVDDYMREQEQRSALAKRRHFATNAVRQSSELDRKLVRRRLVDGDDENEIPNVEFKEDDQSSKAGSLTDGTDEVSVDDDTDLMTSTQAAGVNTGDEDQDDAQSSLSTNASVTKTRKNKGVEHYHFRTNSTIENLFSDEALRATLTSASIKGSTKLQKATRAFAARNTVGFRFKQQLMCLMSILDNARPHYIRCIKPNALKRPNIFDSALVLEQLRYIGVLETIRIRKTGYPVRFRFKDFCERYDLLLRAHGLGNLTPDQREIDAEGGISNELREVIRETLDTHLDAGKWQIGNTSVFLRDHQNLALDHSLRRVQGERATKIQALIRQAAQRKRFEQQLREKHAATKMQAMLRMRKAYREHQERLEEKRAAEEEWQRLADQLVRKHQEKRASVIQKWARVCRERKREAAALKLQTAARGLLAKLVAKRERIRQRTERAQNEAAVKIQAITRGFLSRRLKCHFPAWKAAALRLQRALRAFWRNRLLAQRMEKIHSAALAGDFAQLQTVCEQAIDEEWEVCGVRWRKRNFCTLLHSAVSSGSLEVASYILDEEDAGGLVHGVPVTRSRDRLGNSVLHEAVLAKENIFELCNLLVDHVGEHSAPPEEDEMRRAVQGTTAEEDKVLRDLLLKRKVRRTFHRRVVMLDPTKGTLSYFKNKHQTTPRCALNLGKECGTTLRVSDRYRNCFEIHSPDLLSTNCKAGRMLFKCDTQKQLQEWLSAIRGVEGVGFMAALSALERIDRISWSQVLAFILQENGKQQTVLHLAAAHSLELALWLMAVVSYQGPMSLINFLETPDVEGLTARGHAEKAGRKDIVAAIHKLQGKLNRSSKLASAGRRSITPRTLLSAAKSGGTYLSLYLGRLDIPGNEALEDPVLAVSVINDLTNNKQTKPGSFTVDERGDVDAIRQENSSASIHSTATSTRTLAMKDNDLVEPKIVLIPLHESIVTSSDGNNKEKTTLNFGAMWHMQTPLEQLAPTATVVMQLCHGKNHGKVKSMICLPFNARTIGVGTLRPGQQEMTPAEVDTTIRSGNPFLRAAERLGFTSKKGTVIYSEAEKGMETMHVKVHYSLRSQPCVNCFD